MTLPSDQTIRAESVSGHAVRSVVPSGEPARHRARALADLSAALPTAEGLAPYGAGVRSVATTPDFHPGKPVPVGVVVDVDGAILPHLVGNDIGCGMRMEVLEGVTEDDLVPALDGHLRHVLFQGGRDVALTGRDRRAILHGGVPGLLESLAAGREGLLAKLDMEAARDDVRRMSGGGCFLALGVDPGFDDYARPDTEHRRDAIMGTVGGGNHFVEFGVVDRVEDGPFAHAAGIRKGSVVLVVHSGSLDFGQRVGSWARDAAKRSALPGGDPRVLGFGNARELAVRYSDGLANATNAAFANRFLIALASVAALARACGREVGHRLVYDAPHNTAWREGLSVRHRKGACPAGGPDAMRGTPYEWLGEPVILPGSMGDGTWLLKGLGNAEGLCSAAHGAGRRLSRGEARACATLGRSLRVVGPVDPATLRNRPDVLKDVEARMREEAPDAYRPIDAVVNPMVEAGLVGRVAKVRPVLTAKG